MRRRKPSVPQPKFIYENYDLDEDDIPIFMKVVLNNPWITISEKEKFMEEFGNTYLSNKNFRKQVKDKVLVFEKNKYIGYTDREDIFNIGTSGIIKNIVNIGELTQVNSFSSIIVPENKSFYTKTLSNFSNKTFDWHNPYFVSINFSHISKLKKGCFITTELLFDTGNMITSNIFQKWWNYEEIYFDSPDDEDIESIDSESSNNLIIENSDILISWSENIGFTEDITLNMPTGNSSVKLVLLKNPMYISIGNLKPVIIHKFLMGLRKEDNLMPLLGLDIINQHTSIISKFNGNIELRITNQREEI